MLNSKREPDLIETNVGLGQFSTSDIGKGEERPLADGSNASPLKMMWLVKLHPAGSPSTPKTYTTVTCGTGHQGPGALSILLLKQIRDCSSVCDLDKLGEFGHEG